MPQWARVSAPACRKRSLHLRREHEKAREKLVKCFVRIRLRRALPVVETEIAGRYRKVALAAVAERQQLEGLGRQVGGHGFAQPFEQFWRGTIYPLPFAAIKGHLYGWLSLTFRLS